jgi:FAD/FMN-containing dehydrogenase
VGGFLGGGSGGIGSVAHGGLRDFGTVRAIEVVTMEAEPRILKHEGEAVHEILHAWGTNGIITRIWLALTPAIDWSQCAVAFDSFDAAFDFSERIATGEEWIKRLVTTFEWPIPSFFAPMKQYAPEGKSVVFFLIAAGQLSSLESAAKEAGGAVTFSGSYLGLRTRPLLSDYTWNHTTLWAMKSDEAYTYLQCGFDPDKVREQLRRLKERFANEILFHMEFMKNGTGRVIPGAIPVVYFTTEERLNEMIDFCRGLGVYVANPHVNNVEGGGRYREDNVQLLAKQRYDPKGLLNPGKMITFHREAATTGAKNS